MSLRGTHFVSCLLMMLAALPSLAQQPNAQLRSGCARAQLSACAMDLLKDQPGEWSSPSRLRTRDLKWIVPFAASTAVALHYDSEALQHFGHSTFNRTAFQRTSDISGIYGPIATSVSMFAIGHHAKDPHLQETGALSGEALLDAVVMNQELKLLFNRQRPDQGDHTGKFWPHGFRDYPAGGSFPSGHAMMAWSFASVVSSEYPKWWVRALTYGGAATASFMRVSGRKHFPSDVLVGSGFGFMIGKYTFHHHSSFEGSH